MNGEHSDALFKISWTLTPNADTIIDAIFPDTPNTLLELAEQGNAQL